MMDPDDFRACLISMGYDLVSATRAEIISAAIHNTPVCEILTDPPITQYMGLR